jgi:hypothetical protein
MAMASALLGPILENNLRREVGSFGCAQLVASCSLVAREQNPGAKNTSANLAAIQNTINTTLERIAARTLGHRYFYDMRFVISGVTLPTSVQAAVNDAQAQYVGVSRARATVMQAHYRAQALKLLADVYNKSPGLVNIEALKAVPRNATVILSTGGKTPSIIAGAGNGATSQMPQLTATPPTSGSTDADVGG